MEFISAKIDGDEGWGGRGGGISNLVHQLDSISITNIHSDGSQGVAKPGSLPVLNPKEKEIVTIGSATKTANAVENTHEKKDYGLVWSWEDQILKKMERPVGKKRKETIVWRPGSGRHVDEGSDSYRPFKHIVRVLHLEDAMQVFLTQRMHAKKIVTFSSIDSRDLHPSHPCAKTKVLWFSAKCDGVDEEPSNWYGNVEFAVDAQILLRRWKYSFLVEMMTAPTHTTSRILVTNKDYSSVLPQCHRNRAGGPWRVTASEEQLALIKCSRYQFKGTNLHEHVLEFMVEATPADEKAMLQACQISFKSHERAKNTAIPHVCNRYQRAGQSCPTPFSASEASRIFFQELRAKAFQWNRFVPRFSPEAQKQWEWFNEDERKKAAQCMSVPYQGHTFYYGPVYYAQY